MASITSETIADIERPTDIRISSDGKRVVYVFRPECRKAKTSVTSLWLAEVGTENSARQLTSGNFNDTAPQFSPDGRHIAFISDRDTVGKSSTIYLLPVDGGEALPLTPKEYEEGIESYQWSPDGQSIAFTSPDEKTETKKDEERRGEDVKVYGEDWEYARLRIINRQSKETTTLVAVDEHVLSLAWSPDGTSIAYTTSKTPDMNDVLRAVDICTVSIKDGATRMIRSVKTYISDLVWHNDNLFWCGGYNEDYQQTSMALWRASALPNSEAERVAHGSEDCAHGLRKRGNNMVVHVQSGLFDYLEWCDPQNRILEGRHSLEAGWDICVADESTIAAVIKSSLTGAEVFSYVDGHYTQLSQHTNASIKHLVKETKTIETKGDDGFPLDGVIYFGQEPSDRPCPAVVLIRGGPYNRVTQGDDAVFTWTPWLLSRGYTVLLPNYRGGSGHGAKYAETVRGDAAASYQDVVALTKKCVADGFIDERRVAVAGWSQGGYLSYLAVTRDSEFRFAAAIAGAGVADWDTMVMMSDIPAFQSEIGGQSAAGAVITDLTARRHSPIWFMQNISTPLLILHGENDVRVPVSQAVSFHREMLTRDKTCEMVIYPREGHGDSSTPFERAHYVHMLKKVEEFLGTHLVGHDA